MVRNVVRPVGPPMLTVREVAEELAVCRATVYALLERGELERVWVGRCIRIPAASLDALLVRGRCCGAAGSSRFSALQQGLVTS
ncbi:helix-turn-helix domain-containing protein [Archangium gephyra]|uniref:helix-turn-helix domain-containing protein n=1 Tax=Archangium gephyra TaxID=48 RepID=UPI003B7FD7B3